MKCKVGLYSSCKEVILLQLPNFKTGLYTKIYACVIKTVVIAVCWKTGLEANSGSWSVIIFVRFSPFVRFWMKNRLCISRILILVANIIFKHRTHPHIWNVCLLCAVSERNISTNPLEKAAKPQFTTQWYIIVISDKLILL